MSNELTKEQQKELEKLTKEITAAAKDVVEDFVKDPSENSGSVHPSEGKVKGHGVMVGAGSDYLDEDIVPDITEVVKKEKKKNGK